MITTPGFIPKNNNNLTNHGPAKESRTNEIDCVQQATLATPHIAGHSFEEKFNGTLACYQALCKKYNLTPAGIIKQISSQSDPFPISKSMPLLNQEALLYHIIKTIYCIEHDDEQLRSNSSRSTKLNAPCTSITSGKTIPSAENLTPPNSGCITHLNKPNTNQANRLPNLL